MIEQVDRAIENFFRREVPLPEASVAISFETPDRAWGAGRTRPTISAFLWQIVRNPRSMRGGMEERRGDGSVQRRPVTPIVDVHYLLTAWTSEPRDEHQLLGSLLTTILSFGRLPEEALPESLAGSRCGIGLAPPDVRPPAELWTALGGAPRAAILLEVSLPIEVFSWKEAGPPAESIGASVHPVPRPAPPPVSPEPPVLTRRRANGSLLMEGRAERQPSPAESPSPAGS